MDRPHSFGDTYRVVTINGAKKRWPTTLHRSDRICVALSLTGQLDEEGYLVVIVIRVRNIRA
jgi:hypothetical protein